MRIAIPLLLLTGGCLEQTALQCPANTSLVGSYSLVRSANKDGGDACTYTDDAGAHSLAVDNPQNQQASLCFANTSDAGPQLQLLVAGKGGLRTSDLLPDGGFHFASDPVVAQGTACTCDVSVVETFDGFLTTSPPFGLLPDGGLPPVSGLTGTQSDRITAPAAGCGGLAQRCNVPCSLSYAVSSSAF
jgi:hypothetical protein